jgi:phosphohistidine phosphatase
MELFLLRHGIAVEPGTPGFKTDESRALTDEGRRKLRGVAAAMRAMDLHFDAILTSPLVRARQTAEIVAAELKFKEVQVVHALRPAGTPRAVIEALQPYAGVQSLLLVGHEPNLSELVTTLISAKSGSCIVFKKAGLCRLEADALRPGRAILHWLLTPAQMLRLR